MDLQMQQSKIMAFSINLIKCLMSYQVFETFMKTKKDSGISLDIFSFVSVCFFHVMPSFVALINQQILTDSQLV